jgi:hypothetical protein
MPVSPRGLPRAPVERRRRISTLRCTFLLAFVLIGAQPPSTVEAQALQPADPGLLQSPLELLLERRASLELTAAQLDRLESIRNRLATENDPLVNRMMELRREWQQQRQAPQKGGRQQRAERQQNAERQQRIRADAEPIRAQIQQNNRTAMQAVNRLLTPAQRAQVRGIVQERRQQNAAKPSTVRSSRAGGVD